MCQKLPSWLSNNKPDQDPRGHSSIPGLSGLRICVALSCGGGHRHSSDPLLLWLWCRLTAAVLIRPLAWEILYAVGVAPKRPKRKRNFACIISFNVHTNIMEYLSLFFFFPLGVPTACGSSQARDWMCAIEQQGHWSKDARSLTHCTTRELKRYLFWLMKKLRHKEVKKLAHDHILWWIGDESSSTRTPELTLLSVTKLLSPAIYQLKFKLYEDFSDDLEWTFKLNFDWDGILWELITI